MSAGETWQQRYLTRFYNRDRGWITSEEEFHQLCVSVIPPGGRILEIGAGPTNRTSQLLAGIGEVHGIDPDPAVRGNTALTTASLLEDERFPFEEAAYDACVSDWVIEHVRDPHIHLHEIRRVLKPGAPYVFRTPNRRNYVYLASSLVPYPVHQAVASRVRRLPPSAPDPYPTFYRMNTPRKIRQLAASTGLRVDELRLIEKEPYYGLASRALFIPFMAYERAVNASDRLASLRGQILAVLTRPW
jgi:SAM-dependent methyltransferase